MANAEQVAGWKAKISAYKEVYEGLYSGKKPSEKLIESFCKAHGIPWPLPDLNDELDFLL